MFSAQPLKIPATAYRKRVDRIAQLKRMPCKATFPMIDTFPHGAPLGGFGAGTFSRTPFGDFAVWHLLTGKHIYEPIKGCNLGIYQRTEKRSSAVVLNTNRAGVCADWETMKARGMSYAAQYPYSWYTSKHGAVAVTVEQFSPILPHNYKETSYPVACFTVQVENKGAQPTDISVLFSWENMLGWSCTPKNNEAVNNFKFDRQKALRSNQRIEDYEYKGIVYSASGYNDREEALAGEMCLATREQDGTKVYFCTTYDTQSDGHEVWETFAKDGTLKDSVRAQLPSVGGALAVKTLLNPGQVVNIPFVLSWDLPRCNEGRTKRYYTRFINVPGHSAFPLAKEVLKNMSHYREEITRWQDSYTFPQEPLLTSALFNELYTLTDNGTLWDADTGRFTYLECFDYYFYETVDVRYYGAYGLSMFWPQIEKNVLRDLVRTVFEEDETLIDYNVSAAANSRSSIAGEKRSQFIQRDQRKRKHAVPHDIGSPFGSVWKKINAYTWQNANRWKDLNSKFVLMLYRAYYYDGKKDRAFLQTAWPAVVASINYLDTLDKDNDHVPENEAFPDQTFDNWLMRGTSAYCGILRLASFQVAIQIADILEQRESALQWRIMLKQAKDSVYKKLWNGKYFNYDQYSPDIMAAQLMGQWYLDQLHLPAVILEADSKQILDTILKFNFKNFAKGRLGVVNGRTSVGEPVACSQGNDVWTGISFALAAHLVWHGQTKKAMAITNAVIKNIYSHGFLFRTPESWDVQEKFIGSMYMRPGAIWAIADALKQNGR